MRRIVHICRTEQAVRWFGAPVVGLLCWLWAATPAWAQAQVSQTSVRTESLASITTDTGDFAPGHRDFSRYATPLWCVSAAWWTEQRYKGKLKASTSLRQRTDSVVRVTRACRAAHHMTVAGIPPQQLNDLLDVALWEQNDALARAVINRMLAPLNRRQRVDAQLALLARIVTPDSVIVPLAEWVVAQIDALGQPFLLERMQAHQALAHLFGGERFADDASARPKAQAEAQQVVALGRIATLTELDAGGKDHLQEAFEILVRLAVTARAPRDTLMAIAQQARTVLGRMGAAGGAGHNAITAGMPLDDVITRFDRNYIAPGQDRHSPQVHHALEQPSRADFWFPAVPGDTTLPVPGKLNLFWRASDNSRGTYSEIAYEINEVQKRYGVHDVIYTVVATTQGFFDLNGAGGKNYESLSGTIHSGSDVFGLYRSFQTPQEEAEFIRWYWQDYHHVPVNVVVRVGQYTFRPAPDGRRLAVADIDLGWIAKDSVPEDLIDHWSVGPDGKIVGGWFTVFDEMLRTVGSVAERPGALPHGRPGASR